MKAKEFDEKIENEDFFDIADFEEVNLSKIISKSLENKKLYLLIEQKAKTIGISPERMAEILLAERLGLI